ncbi:unnamed protein product, partial [Ectocarpus sp. 13 AM-2016]
VQVYREPLCRRYYAAPCSFAGIFSVGIFISVIVTPFFMVYDPYSFWVKTDTYLEQPEVTYTKELLFLAEGFKGGEAFSASFSTLAAVNGLNHPGLRDVVVKTFSTDTNGDGLTDRFAINARLPLDEDEQVHSVKMLAFFRTRLRDRARVEIDTAAYVQHQGALAGASMQVDGDMALRQTWPLSVYGGYTYPYRDDPILDPSSITSAHQILFSSLLARYAARNTTLDFQPRYSIWERAPSYATLGGGGTGAAASRLFNVTAVVRINQQPVLYTPPVSEVLQAGWGKYVVMLAVILFLVDALSAFVFKHQVVETKVVAPHIGTGGCTR